MRVVINESLLNRNRQLSHILFFVSLAGMGIGFFYTWTRPADQASGQLTCLILPLLLLMTITSVRMANQWIREPRPVPAIDEALKGLNKGYTIYHHLLPAPHVLVGPYGVYTLTTVWQDKRYRVQGKKWHGDEGLLRKINGYMRQDLVGNPFQDALFSAQQMQRLVDKIQPDSGVKVQPLVVLIHPNAQVELEDPLLPVLYVDPKKKPSLRQYVRDQQLDPRPTLSQEALDEIDRIYKLMSRQEAAELAGEAYDEADEADEEPLEEVAPATEGVIGTVFVARSGQLYYIGAADGSVEEALGALRADAPQGDLELVHTFETPDAPGAAARLQRRFARKRQKDAWFGLSKKDLAWLQSQ